MTRGKRNYRGWVSLWSTLCGAWLLLPMFTLPAGEATGNVGAGWCLVNFIPTFIVWLVGYAVLAIGYSFSRGSSPPPSPPPPPPVQPAPLAYSTEALCPPVRPRRRSAMLPVVCLLLAAAIAWLIARPEDAATLKDSLLQIVMPQKRSATK